MKLKDFTISLVGKNNAISDLADDILRDFNSRKTNDWNKSDDKILCLIGNRITDMDVYKVFVKFKKKYEKQKSIDDDF